MVQSKIKVYKILSQLGDIREIVLCFDVILSFSFTTQITAAKKITFFIHSSNRKGRTLYIYGHLELLTGFTPTAGCNFLGKTRKVVNDWTKKSEKPPSLLTKTENQTLNWRKSANRGRPQNRKTAVLKCENRKTDPNIGQIRKTENPNAPLIYP